MEKIAKKQGKSTHKTYLESHTAKIIMSCMVLFTILLCINLISAFDWDPWRYYNFNEGSGTVADDSTGTWSLTVTGTNWYAGGKIGGSYQPTADKNNTNFPFDTTSDKTINVWVNRTGAIDVGFLWVNGNGAEAEECFLGYHSGVYGNGWLTYCSAASVSQQIETPVDGSEWIMITVVTNSSHVMTYKNGVLNKSTAQSFVWNDEHEPIFFNSAGGSNPLTNTVVDELSIFNRSLSGEEILELYNSGSGLPYAGEENNITVTLSSPVDSYSSGLKTFNFTAIANATNYNLKNATFYVWNNNHTLFNQTYVNITGGGSVTSNITVQTINNFVIGNYVWNTLFCGDNVTGNTLCVWAPANFTLQIGADILSQSFDNSTYETQGSTFYTNISLIAGANLFAARLVYNGTSYLGTKTAINSTSYAISRTIDIPLLKIETLQNLSFYWEFEYRNGFVGSQNSTIFSHYVNPLIFTVCNATYPTVFWNFTTYNESNREIINNTFDATFDYWLGAGTVTKNYSLDSSISPTTRNFCGNANNTVHNVSAIINIKSPSFYERTFYFNKEKINNTQTNTDLYLQDAGTAVIVEVTNPGLVAMSGYFVKVYRFYPDINQYKIIERAKTDEFGQFVARVIEPNTIKYQFEFLNSNNKILKRTADITIACRSAYCTIPFVIEDVTDDFARFTNLTDFEYTLSFTNSTKTFTYTWNDITGDSATYRMLVQRLEFNGTSIPSCGNQTSTSSSSSLICNVGSDNHQYRVQAFRMVSGEDEVRIAIINVEVNDTAGIFGIEGLFWAFILLFTLIAVGSFNPSLGVILYTVGFIALGVLGIISAPIPVYFATLTLGIVFLWAIRS